MDAFSVVSAVVVGVLLWGAFVLARAFVAGFRKGRRELYAEAAMAAALQEPAGGQVAKVVKAPMERVKPRVQLPMPPKLPPLARITMPRKGEPLHMLSLGVWGLRYADETGIYITWIENRGGGRGAARAYLRGQTRTGKPVVVIEVLHPEFAASLAAMGFQPERLRLRVYPIIPRLVEAAGEDLREVETLGSWCNCWVWRPEAP